MSPAACATTKAMWPSARGPGVVLALACLATLMACANPDGRGETSHADSKQDEGASMQDGSATHDGSVDASRPTAGQGVTAAHGADTAAAGAATSGADTAASGEAATPSSGSSRAALVGTGGMLGGEIRLLRRANAVSGWAAKHRGELEACVEGVSLSAATLVLEIAEDGAVSDARLTGIEGVSASASACIRDVAKPIRFIAADPGTGTQTLDVPLAGR